MKNTIVTIAFTCVISACASTTVSTQSGGTSHCNKADWQQIGHKIGSSGKPVRLFNSLKDDCDGKIAETARASYLEGYREGIKEYCTYENGFSLGEQGKEGVMKCPLELREGFDKGYKIAFTALQKQKEEIKRIADKEQMRKQQTSDQLGKLRAPQQ